MNAASASGTNGLQDVPDDVLFSQHDVQDRGVRDELVTRHMGLVRALCARYVGRGVDREDLQQVAVVGLLKALDRFDPTYGTAFTSFAVPTILGELRRYFRDHGWTVTVPRALQDLRLAADRAREALAQQLGRQPTMQEVARELHVTVDEVVVALDGLRSCYRPESLEHASSATADLGATIEEQVEQAVLTRRSLQQLPPREREIVALRYGLQLSQQEIADRVGVSQMHVSRLLRRSIESMRDALVERV